MQGTHTQRVMAYAFVPGDRRFQFVVQQSHTSAVVWDGGTGVFLVPLPESEDTGRRQTHTYTRIPRIQSTSRMHTGRPTHTHTHTGSEQGVVITLSIRDTTQGEYSVCLSVTPLGYANPCRRKGGTHQARHPQLFAHCFWITATVLSIALVSHSTIAKASSRYSVLPWCPVPVVASAFRHRETRNQETCGPRKQATKPQKTRLPPSFSETGRGGRGIRFFSPTTDNRDGVG